MGDETFRRVDDVRAAAEAAAAAKKTDREAAERQAALDFERDVTRLTARLRTMVNPALDEAVSLGRKRALVWNSRFNHSPADKRELDVARAAWARITPELVGAGYKPGTYEGTDGPSGYNGELYGDSLDLWVEW